MGGLWRTKSVEQSIQDTDEPGHKLKRTLSAWDLTVFGLLRVWLGPATDRPVGMAVHSLLERHVAGPRPGMPGADSTTADIAQSARGARP